MPAKYENASATVDAGTRRLRVAFTLLNDSREHWRSPRVDLIPHLGHAVAQVQIPGPMAPGARHAVVLEAEVPAEPGRYRFDVFPVEDPRKRLILVAEVAEGGMRLLHAGEATSAAYSRQNLWRIAAHNWNRLWFHIHTAPETVDAFVRRLWDSRKLAWSLARRDLMARYRGSAGDALWTVVHPLLLMLLYLFVFGVVLRARFPGDSSTAGFALYFLAGMLPWLAISDPIARAPLVLPEHRNYVKKVVFPLEILNVSHVLSALAAQGVALVLLLATIVALKGTFPLTLLWFPLLLIPQIAMTLGVAWIFSALGVFLRDLAQVTGFLLTLVFFMTPICYPETALPHQWLWLFRKNPVDMLVRGWRAILIEQAPPPAMVVVGSWLAAAVLFGLGIVVYTRLRRSFADVL